MLTLKPFGLACLLAAFAAGAVQAHNFWIEPSTLTPAPGQRLAVRLRVGIELKGDPVPRDPALMKRFLAAGPARDSPVPGVPHTEPAGLVASPVPGLSRIVHGRGRPPVELGAGDF